MEEQILREGHQALSVIPKGDEVIVDNLEDAQKFFWKFKTKDGKVVTLYHKDKKVEKLYDKKAFLRVSEEFPDLSLEEMLRQ